MGRYVTNQKAARWLRIVAVLGMVLGVLAPVVRPTPASAASVVSAQFLPAGGPAIILAGTVYARSGAQLRLNVTTDADTRCVEITGAHTATQTSSSGTTSWTFFPLLANLSEGPNTITATAFRNVNPQGKCVANGGEALGIQTATYIVDNTGPTLTAAVSPAPNAAGWNNSNVSIAWSATDAGAGVASGPTPATDSQTADTPGVTKTATAIDRLGNVGSGSVTIKLDKTLPSILGEKSPAANANGWNKSDVTVTFTCSDALSGIKSCTGGGSVTVSTEGANQSVPGTAVDNADNVNNAGVTGINIDKTAPTLSGAPTTSPNGAGWYSGDVTIHWTAADSLSGLAGSAPADSTISSEGMGLTTSASVSDKAGNTTNATSSPAVRIDKTPPTTGISGISNVWVNGQVTVSLSPADNLSGVASTRYVVDGGATQTGTSFTLSTDGDHTVTFFSTDVAGNAETPQTAHVLIDRTAPTIGHSFTPATYTDGAWTNGNVTVTFNCADQGGSGLASCTAPVTKNTEGEGQQVVGTATDNAGNSSTDTAVVSIDKTAPTISGAPDRAANGNGWYNADVTVGFTCADALSGIDTCSPAQTLGEGANQSASGTATDAAGNSASASVSGISVDKTAPILSGAPTTAPNSNGWYSGDVTIHWTASDALSGLDGPAPADSTITGEGDDLAANASVSDKAGNTKNATVSGIKIDRTAPSTLASVPAPLESGWYAGDVLVTLNTGADLSGIDKTYYSVDGGAAQEYTAPFNHAAKGIHTITFWSADKAGNVEDKTAPGHSITLKIDGVPPTITGSRSPAANGFGWNNSPVIVSFNCSDAESGIAGCSDALTLSNEGAGQSVNGQAQDTAGNTASATVSDINIDVTAPTLTGAATTNPNAFGWYKGDVTVQWTGQDGLSGIDPATQPADSVITGEGSNLGAGPVSISDKAGNTGSGSVSGIKIDRTAPTISGATVNDDGTARSANAAGWFNSAVRVRFSCADTLSGVQECASDVVLSSDGANQSASGTATDKADNSASATKSGINIDSQAPNTTADIQCNGNNGWCRNTATVVLNATDQAGLSGVKEIWYKVGTGNGPWTTVSGATTSVSLNLNGSGRATVLFYAVDNAGNSEPQDGVDVKYDSIEPTINHTLAPAANAGGWNNADVTVSFTADDDSDGSGVQSLSINGAVIATRATSTPSPLTASLVPAISAETAGQTVNASALDFAGNTGTDSITVKLDKTAPTISGAATTSPNASGWYNGPVTIHFTCSDTLSHIATCPADVVLSTNGANQSASGTATDLAGNTASATVSGINIDSVKPIVTLNGVANGGIYTLGAVPTASCSATDALSGLDGSCSLQVTGGLANGVGTYTFTATARDKAGNVETVTGSYHVVYSVQQGTAFFLQPINDTAHETGLTTSVFKAGSTVPVKFQLKDANGRVVQANNLPQWLTPAKGSATTSPVDETVYGDPATTGSTYRWDATSQQYIYNWGTARNQAGYYWRIGVQLDDGQTYSVNIGLR